MKKTIVVIAIVFAFTLGTIFSADIATAVKPATEVIVTNDAPIAVTGTESSPTCPKENIEHWHSAHFSPTLGNVDFIHQTLPTLKDADQVDFHISIDSDEFFEPEEAVIEQLEEMGYQAINTNTNTIIPMTTDHLHVSSFSESFTTICAEN